MWACDHENPINKLFSLSFFLNVKWTEKINCKHAQHYKYFNEIVPFKRVWCQNKVNVALKIGTAFMFFSWKTKLVEIALESFEKKGRTEKLSTAFEIRMSF